MNDFKGMSRDTVVSKIPPEMWYFARNILLTGKYLSITNEKGNEYGYTIPGIVIGYIITNEDIVYLSIDGSYSCIGYVNIFENEYKPVLKTSNNNFKFNLNCPIEGTYIYNYKKELIIILCDGVNKNSNTPKLINIHNPQVQLSTSKEFINATDYVMFELFNHISLPVSTLNYEQGGLDAEVVHLAFCYIYDDNTDSLISPIIDTAYPNFKGYNTVNRNVKFTLTELSPLFKKIKLAFIIKKSGGTFAYYSPILTIKEGRVEYTLSSEEDLLEASEEEIVISTERFTKIKTITKTATQIEIGNVEQRPPINFQKYANKLTLRLDMIPMGTEGDKYKSHPSLLPDEVYSFNIVPIYLDGTKGGAYHIPGREILESERQIIPNNELGVYGLNFIEFKNKNYKRFHFENHGRIYADGTCKFGAWENENTYPDKEYYNSSDIGGEDLRGKPVRYHRIPSLDKMDNSYYSTLRTEVSDTIDNNKIGYMPKFSISITNFEEAFPIELRKLLQGYEITLEKRTKGGTYIETNGLLHTIVVPTKFSFPYSISPEEGVTTSGNVRPNTRYDDFSLSYFTSVEVARDEISITSNIVKVYYGIQQKGLLLKNRSVGATMNTTVPNVVLTERIAAIKDAKYLLANNIASGNRFGEEKLQLQLKHLGTGDTNEQFIPISSGNNDLNILYSSLVTLNKNLYNLENNNDYISMGIILFNKINEPIINGDVFTTNIIKKSFGTSYTHQGIRVLPTVYLMLNYYIYNLYSPISNNYIINGSTDTPVDYILGRQLPIPSGPFIADVFSLIYRDWRTGDINTLNSLDYSSVNKGANLSTWFNDYIEALPPALTENFVNYFPYRVYKGLEIPSESLQTKNLRFFPTNQYYDMRNDRGEIIALRGYNRGLYIQQRYSLFETTISDKLNVTEQETYLGSSQLFDRIPEEVVYNDNIGYIGSNSQFACYIFKDGYVTIDEERGKIFIINSKETEISQRNMKLYFEESLKLGDTFIKESLLGNKVKVDNPFSSIGYLVGYDESNNRLLITRKLYEPTERAKELTFDGEFYKDNEGKLVDFNNVAYFKNKCLTFSYSIDSQTWVCQHDYFPNGYIYNSKGLYSILNNLNSNAKAYKHNSKNVNPSNFYGKQYESYVDLTFNSRLDLSKQYQSISWTSDSIDMNTDKVLQFYTINKMIIMNDFQCSGVIDINHTNLKVTRNVEGKWFLNEFRDMMRSNDRKILDEEGNLINDSLTTSKAWYDQGMFISNYIIARFIWSNKDKIITHVNNVNIKSVISNR